MGYRQQHYIIAKVDGQYKTLASIHHQWLFGRTSLRQMLLTMRILSNKSNQIHIKRELARAPQLKTPTAAFTYPFLATALVLGSSVHDEGHYSANVKPQLLDTKWDTFPNDDGMVIYDITDPEKPRYGFVWLNTGIGAPFAQYTSRLGDKKVLDAKTYVSGYYRDSELGANGLEGLLEEAGRLPLVGGEALESLWPGVGFRGAGAGAEDLEKLSLRESAVEEEIDASSVPEELDEATRRALIDKFHAQPSLLSTGVETYARAIAGTHEVDLTRFSNITLPHILQIIQAASTGNAPIILHLPDHDSLTAADLQTLLQTNLIKTLHLGRTKSIKLKQLVQSLPGSSLQDLTAPLLWARASHMTFGPKEISQAQFRVLDDFPRGTGTPFPLSEILYLTSTTKSKPTRLPSGGLKWTSRAKVSYVALPVQDALLSATRLVSFVPEALARLATTQEWEFADMPISRVVLGIAKKAALDSEDGGIRPLPGRMYSGFSNSHYNSKVRMPGMQGLRRGQWMLIACHERPANAAARPAVLRFSFVGLGEGELLILSAEEFFARFGQRELGAKWEEEMEKLKSAMTSLRKAPEGEFSSGAEMATRTGGMKSSAEQPYAVGDVQFGRVAEDEVVEGIGAGVKLMKKETFNEFPGLEAGTGCQQN